MFQVPVESDFNRHPALIVVTVQQWFELGIA